jgi:23S rRNA (uracil1939-C5)-methyltransferase
MTKIDFRIEHIDPLGQGVSKAEGSVTFIKKTLPNETGTATIYSEKKGVSFAKLDEIKDSSPDRITAECVHFYSCNGCDYQHTTYEKELEFKKAALTRHYLNFLQSISMFTEPSAV